MRNDEHGHRIKAEHNSNSASKNGNDKFYKTIMFNVSKMLQISLNEMKTSLEVRIDALENELTSSSLGNMPTGYYQDYSLSNIKNDFELSDVSANNNSTIAHFPSFPLHTVDSMYKFNTDLENEEYFEAAVQYLANKLNARKESTSMFTRRMQLKNLMFSKRVLRQFTWRNPRGHKIHVFSDLQAIIYLFVQVVNSGVAIQPNIKQEHDETYAETDLVMKKRFKNVLSFRGASKYFLELLKRDARTVKHVDPLDPDDKGNDNDNNENDDDNEEVECIFPILPISTAEAVYEFEKNLKNFNYFKAAVMHFKFELAKHTTTNTTYTRRTSLKQLMFSENLLRKFTWKIPSGAKVHKFCTLTSILNLFVEVIKIDTDSSFVAESDEDFCENIMKQRNNKKSKIKNSSMSLKQVSQYFKDMLKREGRIPDIGSAEFQTSLNDTKESLSNCAVFEDTAAPSTSWEEHNL